jgi:hypothetical protein
MLGNARRRAEHIGIKFALKREDIVLPEKCPILGVTLKWGREYGMPDSYSLDRIEPSLGYVKDNIQIISFRANYLKNDGSAQEHRAIADYMDSLLNR